MSASNQKKKTTKGLKKTMFMFLRMKTEPFSSLSESNMALLLQKKKNNISCSNQSLTRWAESSQRFSWMSVRLRLQSHGV